MPSLPGAGLRNGAAIRLLSAATLSLIRRPGKWGRGLAGQVRRVQQAIPIALDSLARSHHLDELLVALGRPDHDRPHQLVAHEEELAVELLRRAESGRESAA